jgi:hypothetical protein
LFSRMAFSTAPPSFPVALVRAMVIFAMCDSGLCL